MFEKIVIDGLVEMAESLERIGRIVDEMKQRNHDGMEVARIGGVFLCALTIEESNEFTEIMLVSPEYAALTKAAATLDLHPETAGEFIAAEQAMFGVCKEWYRGALARRAQK